VHPVVAAVTLHPALLHLVIVLLLLQVLFVHKANLDTTHAHTQQRQQTGRCRVGTSQSGA
jgi:hypothetical protein